MENDIQFLLILKEINGYNAVKNQKLKFKIIVTPALKPRADITRRSSKQEHQ